MHRPKPEALLGLFVALLSLALGILLALPFPAWTLWIAFGGFLAALAAFLWLCWLALRPNPHD